VILINIIFVLQQFYKTDVEVVWYIWSVHALFNRINQFAIYTIIKSIS